MMLILFDYGYFIGSSPLEGFLRELEVHVMHFL